MGNRIIKESICISDDIDSLSWFEEVLFYRLMVKADDYGIYDGRGKVIKGQCFALKDITVKDVERGLEKLSAVGLVRRYTVGGHPYLQLTGWSKHQQTRNSKAKYPKPEEADEEPDNTVLNTLDINCNQLKSIDINCSPNPIQSNPIRIQSEFESNPNPIHEKRNPKSDSRIAEWFEAFWKLYPRKEGKQNAMKAFEKMCNSEDTYNAIMEGLQKRVKLDWSRRPPEEKKFIPHPSSWLNQSRWLDEVTPYAGKGEGIFAGMTGKPEDYSEPSAEYEKSIEEFFGE